ncbi:MAG: 23S rRNA (guanosine(2251)-2'-O)-methyltransferase RlmB [Thermodesulfobacteriota bacterium]
MSRSPEHLVPGFHAVLEALSRRDRPVMEVLVSADRRSKRVRGVLDLAEKHKVPVRFIRPEALAARLPETPHQGVAAVVRAPAYVDLEDILQAIRNAPGRGLLLAADHITDQGNLGALIRTAAFFGVSGLVIPKDRSAGLGEAVAKRSAGASLFLPVAREVNLARALDRLNQEGFWVIGAAGEAGMDAYTFDWDRDTVLVVGSEDRGLAPNVRAHCHELVSIPGSGMVESLNVAVAAGAVLSEITRQRMRAGST